MTHDDALPALPIGEAEVLWHEPDPVMPERPGKIIDASHAFMDAAPLGTRLYSAEQMRAYARAALAARAEPPVPDGVWEALQRLIENAGAAGPASTEDALLVARYRRRLLAARAEPVAVQACRPEDRAILATPAGAELVSAVASALASEPVPEAVRTAPERIWLQISDDESDLDEPIDDITNAGLTWCWHSIGGAEVEYVRADLAAPPALPPEAREAMRMAADALDEATTYVESPSWSPSMARECRAALNALRPWLREGE